MSVVVSELTRTYGEQKAVNNIFFQVDKGEIVGFLGPNGAGKSTTMKIATGYLPPSSGTITVSGFDVTEAPIQVQKRTGYLPEHNPLYLDMYVHEYLRFIGALHKVPNISSRVMEMIRMTGLTREQNKKVGQLSKGYRQRVGLAQALIHDPEVLILDEPTTGLDPNQILEIRSLIKEISKEKTVILSTHIMQEVQALCDRVVIINLGKIVADSPVSELMKESGKSFTVTAEFTGDIEEEKIKQLDSVRSVEKEKKGVYKIQCREDIREELFKIASAENWVLLGMKQQEASMEEVFRQLTKSQQE